MEINIVYVVGDIIFVLLNVDFICNLYCMYIIFFVIFKKLIFDFV